VSDWHIFSAITVLSNDVYQMVASLNVDLEMIYHGFWNFVYALESKLSTVSLQTLKMAYIAFHGPRCMMCNIFGEVYTIRTFWFRKSHRFLGHSIAYLMNMHHDSVIYNTTIIACIAVLFWREEMMWHVFGDKDLNKHVHIILYIRLSRILALNVYHGSWTLKPFTRRGID
jgi:hypothetical protein